MSSGGEEATMDQDDKTGKVTATIQEIAYYNMFLIESLFELPAEIGVLTGEEVLERIKKLKRETPVHFSWMQQKTPICRPIFPDSL
jgi:hypothetical protein